MNGPRSVDKDAKFWNKVDLKREEVPQGEHDLGNDYVSDNVVTILINLFFFRNESKLEGLSLSYLSRLA
jgi:hypothetical protein